MHLFCDKNVSITVAPECNTGCITVCDDDTDEDEAIDAANDECDVDLVGIVVGVLVVCCTTDILRTEVSSNFNLKRY